MKVRARIIQEGDSKLFQLKSDNERANRKSLEKKTQLEREQRIELCKWELRPDEKAVFPKPLVERISWRECYCGEDVRGNQRGEPDHHFGRGTCYSPWRKFRMMTCLALASTSF